MQMQPFVLKKRLLINTRFPMKNIFLLFAFYLLIISCSSIQKHNQSIDVLVSAEKLREDVDFTYQKLQKLQPKMDWYISKEKLALKFDSLKNSIQAPMKPNEFHKKLASVTNGIGQGHLIVYPKTKQLTKKETRKLAKRGNGPLSQLDFEIFENKLFVVKNKSYNSNIKVGTEVLSINKVKSQDLIKDFSENFTSDGFNKTFFHNMISKRFGSYYSNKNGILDSLKYELKFKDSIKTITIKRKNVDSILNPKKKIIETTEQIAARKIIDKQKKIELLIKDKLYGYDKENKRYNRNLSFREKDSSVAVIKINGFQKTNFRKCYEQFFQKIKDYKSKTLILDLRNNSGGRLSEINNLYSYLAEKEYIFVQPSEVASKTSLLQMDYFKGTPLWAKPFQIASIPIFYPILYFKTKKGADGKWYTSRQNKPKKLADNNFKGKIYVLINGGSFSASSIISSNLKGSKRAFFVGEETGGAFNGTVAGQMPLVKTPNAGLNVRVGLIVCKPYYQTDVEGRGIFPDKEILPTIEDRISGNDPEMMWILDDISKSQNTLTIQ